MFLSTKPLKIPGNIFFHEISLGKREGGSETKQLPFPPSKRISWFGAAWVPQALQSDRALQPT